MGVVAADWLGGAASHNWTEQPRRWGAVHCTEPLTNPNSNQATTSSCNWLLEHMSGSHESRRAGTTGAPTIQRQLAGRPCVT